MHTHSNKKKRRQKTRHRKLFLTALTEQIKQQSSQSHRMFANQPELICHNCINKCLSLCGCHFEFSLHICAFIRKLKEELLILFSSSFSRSFKHSHGLLCWGSYTLTRAHTHTHWHTDWPIDPPQLHLRAELMAISVLAVSLRDCSVQQKCVCIDLIPSSRKDSAHSVCALRLHSDILLFFTVTQSILLVNEVQVSIHCWVILKDLFHHVLWLLYAWAGLIAHFYQTVFQVT